MHNCKVKKLLVRETDLTLIGLYTADEMNKVTLALSLKQMIITYLQLKVSVLQRAPRHQRPLHGPKLSTFGNAPLGEDASLEVVNVEDKRKACTRFGHHGSVNYWVERTMLQAHSWVGIITFLTPWKKQKNKKNIT